RPVRRHRRRPLQAHRLARRRSQADLRGRERARADRSRQGDRHGGRRGRRTRNPHLRNPVIGSVRTDGSAPVSITGLGCEVPERVLTNDELSRMVDTTDEWIVSRTGIRERRIVAPDEALSDIAIPAARTALQRANVRPADLDLIIVTTVTPDMLFPTTAAI